MNPHFQARGRGTGPLYLPYPHPDMSEVNPCPSSTVFSLCKCQDKPRSGIKTRTVCLWAQLIHNRKHTLVAPSLTHISPINSQFCSTHGDCHSSLCTQDTKSPHSSRSRPNPTDGITVACKALHSGLPTCN